MTDDIYEVDRSFYKQTIQQIKKGACHSTTVEYDDYTDTVVYSDVRKVVLAKRRSFKDETIPEKYYVYLLLSEEESIDDFQPRRTIVLENQEQVQRLMDLIKEQRKNEGIIS